MVFFMLVGLLTRTFAIMHSHEFHKGNRFFLRAVLMLLIMREKHKYSRQFIPMPAWHYASGKKVKG